MQAQKPSNINNENILLNKDEVLIESLSIKNIELVEYLKNSDNKEEALLEIISIGVKTLNTLKNSIEKDFTKQVFDEMSKSMDETLESTMISIQKEFDTYFDDEEGKFIKELNDSSSDLSQKLKEEFDNFLDPEKTESAISKIKEVLSDSKDNTKKAFE